MALNQYCEFNEVRAALGVNDVELSDAVLSLPIYEIGLARELAKISASLPAAFSAVLGVEAGARTEVQGALFNAVRMFSVYACAKQVGASLASLIPKDITDGKASLSRFSDSPYRDTLERVGELLALARADVPAALAAYLGQTTTAIVVQPVMFLASGRKTDPVTGS